jgi:hypothetical protein
MVGGVVRVRRVEEPDSAVLDSIPTKTGVGARVLRSDDESAKEAGPPTGGRHRECSESPSEISTTEPLLDST